MAAERDRYLTAWRQGVDDLLLVMDELVPEDLAKPTDCPGWTVHDVVAHLAAIESDLANGTRSLAGPSAGARAISAEYTQAGVAARAGRTLAELRAEFARSADRRAAALAADPPDDLDAPAWLSPSDVNWDWRTLLRNRVVDVWVHEQDIRRAVGRPGNLDSPAAEVVVRTFAGALPFVVGRKVRPPVGTVIELDVDGLPLQRLVIDDSGRCVMAPADERAVAVTVRLSREALTLLGAGRRRPGDVAASVAGDVELGERILASLAVTP